MNEGTSNEDVAELTEYKWLCFFCPGCKRRHCIPVKQYDPDQGWQWNGSLETPTLHPSLLVYAHDGIPPQPRCHSFITNGKIQFLGDCEHDLKNQTVPLEPIPPEVSCRA